MPAMNPKDLKLLDDWRILVYGKTGVGKTTTARNLDGKIYALAFSKSIKVMEGKIAGLWKIDATRPIEDFNDFAKQFQPDKYDVLLIDDISNFEKLWFQEKGRESKNGISNEIQHYSEWVNYFLRIIEWLFDLPINIYITAWENQYPITTSSGQQFNQYSPQLRDSVRNTVMGLCDIVGRLTIKPDTGDRVIILQGDDGVYAKNRLDKREQCKSTELFKFGDQ